MTFPVQTPQNVFIGNAVTTVFAYTFEVADQPDNLTVPALNVFLITPGAPNVVLPLVLNTDYTLTGVGAQGGGNLTTIGAHSPPANGSILVLQRALDLTQQTAFPNQGFLPSDIEAALDTLTQMVQQLNLKSPDMSRVTTVAGLPSAVSNPFTRRMVTDATVNTFGTVVAGGGTLTVPVYSDAANWRIG